MGYGNAVGNIAGILAPVVTGVELQKGGCPVDTPPTNASTPPPPPISAGCRDAWAAVWSISAGWLVAGALIFTAFASTRRVSSASANLGRARLGSASGACTTTVNTQPRMPP